MAVDLVREYRADMVRRGLSPSTVQARLYELRRWIGHRSGSVLERDEIELCAFLDHRPSGMMLGPRARYTAISHLHDFYKWAIRTRLTDVDPTVRTLRPRLPAGLPRPIDDEDLALAVATADEPVRTMLLLGALAGMRCAEIHSLRWADVHLARAELRVMGKGQRERVIPIPAQLVDHLATSQRRRGFVRVVPSSSAGRVSQLVNAHLHDLGIMSTAHQLRHWYGTQALRSSSDISKVQALLGHASPATTAIYAKLDPTGLAPIVKGLSIPNVA